MGALLIYIGWGRQGSIRHDEELFKQPPLNEDCPICMLPLPTLGSGWVYYSCCGKTICGGCLYAVAQRDKDQKCPFCRTPAPKSEEEQLERLEKRMEVGDADAIHNQGLNYLTGRYGLQKDYTEAFGLLVQAVELGCAEAYNSIGTTFYDGKGVDMDAKKAKYYYDLAAIGGDVTARHNLGNAENNACNVNRALKHYMIAAGSGQSDSVKAIRELYSNGLATKDDYTKALRAYQAHLNEIKSEKPPLRTHIKLSFLNIVTFFPVLGS